MESIISMKRIPSKSRRPIATPKRRLTEYVTCRICSESLQKINHAHLRTHEVTREEYMAAFNLHPHDLMADSLRAQLACLDEYFPYRRREMRQAIREIYRQDGRVNERHCEVNHPAIYAQGVRLYKTWDRALAAAGFNPDEIREHLRWSKSKVIRAIKERHTKGLSLSGAAFDQSEAHVLKAAGQRYFGSWRNAIIAAGLSPQEIGMPEEWPEDRILSELRALAGRGGSMAMSRNLSCIARNHFGTVRSAVAAAGIDPESFFQRKRWSREMILAAIGERHKRGLPLLPSVVEKEDCALVSAAARVFGNWRKALLAAGVDPSTVYRAKEQWSKERIIAEIRRLGQDVRQKGKPLLKKAAVRYFGSWPAALDAAGVTSKRK